MSDESTKRRASFVPRPHLRFDFDELKAAQAAAYLIRKTPERAFNYMHLIKLLYLVDRTLLVARGQPLTGDGLVSMEFGPVLTTVLDLVKAPDKGDEWSKYIVKGGRWSVAIDDETPDSTSELSKAELRTLDEVFERYGKMDRWKLVQHLHEDFPEWEDPGKSSTRIEPAEILEREGWEMAEIREIEGIAKVYSRVAG
jgi:uncharacterized phage-associated protein